MKILVIAWWTRMELRTLPGKEGSWWSKIPEKIDILLKIELMMQLEELLQQSIR